MNRTILDKELKAAIEQGTPVQVVDAATQEIYYVLSAEQFEKFRGVLSADFDPREIYPFIEKIMAEDDANDPFLDRYQ